MIDLKREVISLGDKTEPIQEWKVWFQTPVGLFKSLNAAVNACEILDLTPALCINFVPVAISETLYEVRS